MEKEKFEQMLKEYLKSNAKIELVIDEDKKGMYDNSTSFTFKVQLIIDEDVILDTQDTLYLG